MRLIDRYRLRLERRRLLYRAFRRRRQLTALQVRTRDLSQSPVLAFTTLRNERVRLPFFLDYYRELGVNHFLMVDNGSTDGSREFLLEQNDVSLWSTDASYRWSRFGADWLGWLQMRYGHGRWCLTVDTDEFLIYPFCDTRPLSALTNWMDASGLTAFPAMLLDLYPKGPLTEQTYSAGQNPFEAACWFDSGNYTIKPNRRYGNLWIQGGPRARAFFADDPAAAPALNKIPLVKWNRRYAYRTSTHNLLPRGLNIAYATDGGEAISGCLLHAKFIGTFATRAAEEAEREEHYAAAREYKAYAAHAENDHIGLWNEKSERYLNWRQLEILGLVSKGSWA